MPGMGGFGQIFGSMGRGMAGGMGGGMGRGGLGGFGAGRGGSSGGQGGSNGAQSQDSAAEGASDLYDVDRWQRAEEEQAAANREYADTGMSALEQVKKEWENKSEKKSSRLKKLLRKDNETGTSGKIRGTAVQTEQKDYAGTQYVRANPARKMAEERRLGQTSVTVQQGDEERYFETAVNRHAVPVKSEFERFFSSNPVNSVILCGDSLSMGPLTMNQLYQSHDRGSEPHRWDHNSDTGYMDNLKESSQRRKYEVHIVNGE